jgi:hypothetical protein
MFFIHPGQSVVSSLESAVMKVDNNNRGFQYRRIEKNGKVYFGY